VITGVSMFQSALRSVEQFPSTQLHIKQAKGEISTADL
jgi:hypothetical protein